MWKEEENGSKIELELNLESSLEVAGTLINLGYQLRPWCDDEVMTHARMSARTYVTHYLRSIRAAQLEDVQPTAVAASHLRY